tara:strand:- start:1 stop:351 length:351 start_codon:yes stop_codon:yes gene_type:complete
MIMYKIISENTIKRISDNAFIPKDEGNVDYQKFKKDVVGIGLTCVEGADVETEISYVDARILEYPPLQEQLDKIYHDGVESWKADIKAIKDMYPKTQVSVNTISPLPQWVIDLTSS